MPLAWLPGHFTGRPGSWTQKEGFNWLNLHFMAQERPGITTEGSQ